MAKLARLFLTALVAVSCLTGAAEAQGGSVAAYKRTVEQRFSMRKSAAALAAVVRSVAGRTVDR